MEDLARQIVDLFAAHGAVILLLGMFLENALLLGVLVPGITLMLLAGVLVHAGSLDPLTVIAAGVAGTLAGDNVNYLLGRYALGRFPAVRRLLDSHPEVRAFVRRRSPPFYVLFHFPPYLRTFFPMMLGSAGFSPLRWIGLDVPAALLFVVSYVALGYVLAGAGAEVTGVSGAGQMATLLVSAVFVVWAGTAAYRLIRRIRRRRARRVLTRAPGAAHGSPESGGSPP